MRSAPAFSHEALLYGGDDGFVNGTTPFIREAVAAGEPILVVVGERKIRLLRAALGGDAEHVSFADMADVGANPARIIPAWREFVDANSAEGRVLRGIGEPIYPERGSAELVECQRHESLLNLAFADADGFRLLCPYDTEALETDVIGEACSSHPVVGERRSADYRGLAALAAPFDDPLPPAPAHAQQVAFDHNGLEAMRVFVAGSARDAGLSERRVDDLVLAAHELTANTIRHAAGGGVFRLWTEADTVICEVADDGRIEDPLVGRRAPAPGQVGGYGLWIVNQLCDLVQIRSFPAGSVVRLHMRLR